MNFTTKNKEILMWLVLAAVGVSLLIFANVKRDIADQATPSDETDMTKSNGQNSDVLDEIPPGISKVPPVCNLSGRLVFIEEKLFRNENGKLNYNDVFDSHDIVNWTISPDEDVSVGPNRFSRLPLPQGNENITIGFNDGPKQKEYTLTASIDYPAWVDRAVKVVNVPCSGETKVVIDY